MCHINCVAVVDAPSAVITGCLVKRSFNLDHTQVLFSRFQCLWLPPLGTVHRSYDGLLFSWHCQHRSVIGFINTIVTAVVLPNEYKMLSKQWSVCVDNFQVRFPILLLDVHDGNCLMSLCYIPGPYLEAGTHSSRALQKNWTTNSTDSRDKVCLVDFLWTLGFTPSLCKTFMMFLILVVPTPCRNRNIAWQISWPLW